MTSAQTLATFNRSLNYQKIQAVSEYVCSLTEMICSSDLKGPFDGSDTTETELRFLREAVQPVLNQLGAKIDLKSRGDIDRLVELLIDRLGL